MDLQLDIHLVNNETQNAKNSSTGDMIFLNKSWGEWDEIEKCTFVWDDGLDDDDDDDDVGESVPVNNGNYNVASDDSDCDAEVEDNFLIINLMKSSKWHERKLEIKKS